MTPWDPFNIRWWLVWKRKKKSQTLIEKNVGQKRKICHVTVPTTTSRLYLEETLSQDVLTHLPIRGQGTGSFHQWGCRLHGQNQDQCVISLLMSQPQRGHQSNKLVYIEPCQHQLSSKTPSSLPPSLSIWYRLLVSILHRHTHVTVQLHYIIHQDQRK